jgi:hypothetical protein
MCREQCEMQLDQYFEYKRRTKLPEKVLFAGEAGPDWDRACARAEEEQQGRLAKLAAWLDRQTGP